MHHENSDFYHIHLQVQKVLCLSIRLFFLYFVRILASFLVYRHAIHVNTNQAYDTWIAMYMYVIFLHNIPPFSFYAGITKKELRLVFLTTPLRCMGKKISIDPHSLASLYKILCKKRITGIAKIFAISTMYKIMHIKCTRK